MVSCFKDNTTVDTVRISAITIDTLKLQKEYNIDKNVILPIAPEVSQAEKDLPLTYEWEVNYKLYSDAAQLAYTGDELGSFPARLKVSNAHGSAYYHFTINVNSPYEEGITLLSKASDGTMMLSMMRNYSAEELAAGKIRFFNTHCLTVNNPEIEFARRPTDIVQRGSQLFISCIESPTVYVVNHKTMEMENIMHAPEYPNFRPMRMMIFDANSRSAPTICENGMVYNLASLEQQVLPHTVFKSTYSQVSHGYASTYQTYYYLWDNVKKMLGFFNGYSLFFGEQFAPPYTGHEPIAMFNNMKGSTFSMISRHNGEYWQTTLGMSGPVYDAKYNIIGIDIKEHIKIGGTPAIESGTPFASSPTYRSIYYAVGNKVYRKYFSDTVFPGTPWFTVDLAGAQITALTVSPDDKQLYVGVSQSGVSGLNGHVYILDSQTGAQVSGSPYMNVGYAPVKIMYKSK